ncbi:hypothetical protein NIES39_O01700 [Arthrospira platensis NIES-39]|nr:hypothetical protein NIES39_O01700 [Arthrospira platensis NIES-39]
MKKGNFKKSPLSVSSQISSRPPNLIVSLVIRFSQLGKGIFGFYKLYNNL